MTRDDFLRQLEAAGACREGRLYVAGWDPEWSPDSRWPVEPRGDFMLWLLVPAQVELARDVACHVVRRLVGEWIGEAGHRAMAEPTPENVLEAFCDPESEPAAFAASGDPTLMHRAGVTSARMRMRKGHGNMISNLGLVADAVREKVPTFGDAEKMITEVRFTP